ncbi:rod shape-determining protein RodA [Candidatus Parcubacteria bacterium]|jgi:rod shape determining protein RodA|nr:MAG: rod shape-determining protein RodA [Candidatus Parcubacteria bacterium]
MSPVVFQTFRRIDWLLLVATILLIFIGLIALASVTVAKAPPEWKTFLHQLAYLGLGLILALGAITVDYRVLRGYSTHAYILAVLLLVGVLFFGTTIRSTTGWFIIGGVSFQPVEVAKLLWILAFSAYLARYARAFDQWRHLAISGAFMVVLVALVLRQPDLGSAVVIIVIYLGLLLLANVRPKQLAILFLILISAGVLSYFFILQDYQKDRIRVLFQPNADPLGRGYNVTQSIIAIGSGNLFGRGFGQGTQSQLNFLPEQQTDFIFSVFAEEFGFLGSAILLAAYILMLVRTALIARQAREDFGAFLAAGIGIWLVAQLFINVGMNMGLLPVAGIPLPLVSAGGSSLVATLIGLGLVQSIALRSRLTV